MPRIPTGALRRARPAIPAAVVVLASLLAGSFVSAAPAAAADHRVAVPAARPAWSAAAQDLGVAAAGSRVQAQIALELQDEQGAQDFATAVSTPGDPQYGRFLGPADWIARFAPTQQQVDELAAAARAGGLAVDAVPASRLFVLVSADASTVGSFFRTTLHDYTVAGEERVAAQGTVTLPARLARHVATVGFGAPRIESRSVAPAAKGSASPCSSYWRQHVLRIPRTAGTTSASTPLCGYSAKQLRAVSGIGSAGDGAGQTVAVLDAFGSSTIRRDLATYSARNGLPAVRYRESVPARSTWDTSGGCSPAGWRAEQTMDLEAVHAIAPRASLVYVGANDCGYGFDVAMSTVLDQGLASIVSNSWGSPGGDSQAAANLADDATVNALVVNLHQHIQAAGQGIGLYFASGDAGDNAALLGSASVDFPSSSPWVTAVGGTAAALDRRDRVVFTAPWGTTISTVKAGRRSDERFVYGAGGGPSRLFPRPGYQAGAVRGKARASADLAALASPETGMAVGMRTRGRYAEQSVGGTSLATPIVAAQVAIAQQRAGRQLGFLNPALYRAAGAQRVQDVLPSAVHRVVAARSKGRLLVGILDRDSSLRAKRGHDYPTGVGVLTPSSLRALARP